VARSYGVARSSVHALLARHRADSNRGRGGRATSPRAIPPQATTADLIVTVRKDLAGQGLDAGPHTIAWHLAHHHQIQVSAAAIGRNLARRASDA
jgi:hypothetical protein